MWRPTHSIRNALLVAAILLILATAHHYFSSPPVFRRYYLEPNFPFSPNRDSQLTKTTPSTSTTTATSQKTKVDLDPKVILLWTPYFGDSRWKRDFDVFGDDPLKLTFSWPVTDPDNVNPDAKMSCKLTTNRSLENNASALVFHAYDFKAKNLPKTRDPKQRWVYYGLESAANFLGPELAKIVDKVGFNWTMTYHLSSDVYFPYGHIAKRFEPISNETIQRISGFIEDFSQRELDGFWSVSHCKAISGRDKLFKALQDSGLKLEKWGACSHNKAKLDSAWTSKEGVAKFFSRFRFYFAFENSLCDEYISEKPFVGYWTNVNFGLIPVVYGAVNFSRILPPGSYIDATRERPAVVAALMKSLRKPENINKTRQYFDWQYTHRLMYYKVSEKTNFLIRPYHKLFGFQNLCRKVWTTPSNQTSVVTNIKSRIGRCYNGLSPVQSLP